MIDKAAFTSLMSVMVLLQQLVSDVQDEPDMLKLRVVLEQYNKITNNCITAFDKKVDNFFAKVQAGEFGADYNLSITRIHKPKGKTAGPTLRVETPEEKLAKAFAELSE